MMKRQRWTSALPFLSAILLSFLFGAYASVALAQTQPLQVLPSEAVRPSLPSFVSGNPNTLIAQDKAKVASSGGVFQVKETEIIAEKVTESPSPTPALMPTTSITPTPTLAVVAKDMVQPAPTAGNSTGGLNADILFSLVNAHRSKIGLVPFQKDSESCGIASSRAPELQNEIYGGGVMHAGFINRHIGNFATENMISQQTEQDAFNWWLNSGIHKAAIEGNATRSCIACSGNNCTEIFLK